MPRALAFLVALSAAGLYACPEMEGPLERADEKIDESINDGKRSVEDATD